MSDCSRACRSPAQLSEREDIVYEDTFGGISLFLVVWWNTFSPWRAKDAIHRYNGLLQLLQTGNTKTHDRDRLSMYRGVHETAEGHLNVLDVARDWPVAVISLVGNHSNHRNSSQFNAHSIYLKVAAFQRWSVTPDGRGGFLKLCPRKMKACRIDRGHIAMRPTLF